jgi:hypothetical protein
MRIKLVLAFFILISIATRTQNTAASPRLTEMHEEGATIYDDNGNGQADLIGDTWVYDTNSDGLAELLIRFRQESQLTAYVYDDSNDDGKVDYTLGPDGVIIQEPYWRVKVTARDNQWIFPNGQPDWNLGLAVDSGYSLVNGIPAIPRQTCWSESQKVAAISLQNEYKNAEGRVSKIDGVIDFNISYWSLNNDNIPNIEWQQGNGSKSTDSIFVNLNPDWRLTTTNRFPLLETVLDENWATARLNYIRPLIANELNKAGYDLTNIQSIGGFDGVGYGLENPLAFYNLRNSPGCTSDLIIRLISEGPVTEHPNILTYDEVRYSWAQNSDAIQYRLYLIGRVLNTDAVNYPPYRVEHVTYQNLPSFVISNIWRGASFAEEEGATSHLFTEGIPENTYYTPMLRSVILEHQDQSLPDYFPVDLNLREEYNLVNFDRSPHLYYGSIDRRLHLFGARQGIIIFSADTSHAVSGYDFGGGELRKGTIHLESWTSYVDANEDGYIDTWMYYENSVPVTQLVFRNGGALLATSNTISIKVLPADFRASEWEASPPSTQAEWQDYQDHLIGEPSRRTLSDLSGIFSDLPGDTIVLTNSNLLSVSSQDQELIAEFITQGLSLPSSISNPFGGLLSPGLYILQNNSGTIQVSSPRPALLQLTPLIYVSSGNDPKEKRITFSVLNPSLSDVNAHILVQARTGGLSVVLLSKEVPIPALGKKEFNLPWLPATPGEQFIEAQLQYSPESGGATQTLSQDVKLIDNFPNFQGKAFYLTQPYLVISILMASLLVGLLIGSWLYLADKSSSNNGPKT